MLIIIGGAIFLAALIMWWITSVNSKDYNEKKRDVNPFLSIALFMVYAVLIGLILNLCVVEVMMSHFVKAPLDAGTYEIMPIADNSKYYVVKHGSKYFFTTIDSCTPEGYYSPEAKKVCIDVDSKRIDINFISPTESWNPNPYVFFKTKPCGNFYYTFYCYDELVKCSFHMSEDVILDISGIDFVGKY